MFAKRFPFRRLLGLLLALAMIVPAVLSVSPARAQPPPPVLLQPPDFALTTAENHPPTGTPTFSWQAVTDADRYTIQVCPSAGCSSPRVNQETYATRFTPRDALPDGTWYWRVRAHDSGGWGDYSSSREFTKSWLNYGSLAPQLLEPTAGATVEFFEYPIFSWTPVDGAAYYRFRIFNQFGCPGSAIYTKSTIKPTHTPANRRTRGDYYWQVAAVDHRGQEGDSSECRHFFMDYQQAPTLLAPADDSYQTFTPEFRWTAVKGAKEYHLQVSTVQDFSTRVVDVWVHNTRYTPLGTLANDREYYWRVAARDTMNTEGPWVPTAPELRSFYMAWHLEPVLLSPSDNFIRVPFPVFQWTPVAGAFRYRIQADDQSGYPSPRFNTTLFDPRYDHLNWGTVHDGEFYYWHVRAEDGQGYGSIWSQDYSFQYDGTPAPTLIYPPYYYDPATISATQYLGVRTDPTVPVPVFMWDRVVDMNGLSANTYLIEVDDDPAFGSPEWYTSTENLSIAPSAESPFDPTPGTVYYWRVEGYRGGSSFGGDSERWEARFDPSLQDLSTTLSLYFPADGRDNVHDTPLFGWSPVQGAAQYHFQIGTSPDDWTSPVHEAHPTYGLYTPLERLEPETYYWRVRAQDAGGGYIGDWSEVWRIVITYPLVVGDLTCNPSSCYPLYHPIVGNTYTRVGEDPAGDAYGGTPYDLTDLFLARSDIEPPGNSFWYLAMHVPYTNSTDMYFVFYVDLDHEEGSGATTDPTGFSVQASSIYLPERVLVAHHNTLGQVTAATLYRWQGTYWGTAEDLVSIGGAIDYQRGRYLELTIPLTVFDLGENWLGTVSVQAFTAQSGGQANDTVPSEPSAPTSELTNFTAAADKLNLLHPWDNPFSNPFIQHQNLALSFAKPLFRSYVRSYKIQVDRDISFTPPYIVEQEWTSGSPPMYFFLGTRWTWTQTFEENNTLYWRLRVRHGSDYGPWSQPMRFTKFIYTPDNLTVEYDYATPTFRWDRVEGASSYRVEVDDDPEFGSVNVSAETDNPSHTPSGSMADRTWHWRVRVRDGSNHDGSYELGGSFTKASQSPVLTSPIGGVTVNELPTLQWQDVLYPGVDPVVNSQKYRLYLDNDPNFSFPYVWGPVTVDTNSATPESSLKIEDGTYYWKVAVLDTGGNEGPPSEVGIFYKAYLTPTLISAVFDRAPDLTWAPVDGAATYQVQICRDPFYSSCVETRSTGQTNYVATSQYLPGVYYWRVRMCDQAGACGPYYEDRLESGHLTYLPLVYKDY